jgi:hypothetical protein
MHRRRQYQTERREVNGYIQTAQLLSTGGMVSP